MAKESGKNPSKFEKLRTHFRFVILNDETFKEVSSYRLNLLNIYLLLSSVFVVAGLLAFLLIVFTPLKYLVPNYGELTVNSEFVELTKKTDRLENDLIELQTYIDGNKNRLFGNDIVRSSEVSGYQPDEVELIQSKSTDRNNADQINYQNFLFSPPVAGIVSADYDTDVHAGIDIIVKKNTAIMSIADGYVISSDYSFSTGNTIGVQHSNNIISFYKHNSKLLKKPGEFVSAGEAIAIAGNTGELSSGPHLHFELWIDGAPVDPAEFIDF